MEENPDNLLPLNNSNNIHVPIGLQINHTLLPELLPSAKAYVILKHYVSLPIFATSILCILVTIVVVTRRGLWRPTVTYVVMLAIVDLLILVLLSVLSIDYFIIPWASEGFRMWFYSAETVLGETVDTLLFISNWLTAMLATERYIAICYPLHSRRISRKHRRIVVTLVVIGSVLIRIPGFVLMNMSNDPVAYPNIGIYHRCYAWLAQIFLFLIIPFALLTFVNLRLIQAVRQSSKLLRATYGKGLAGSYKGGTNSSEQNSVADSSNRQNSRVASDYFKFHSSGRNLGKDSLIGLSQQDDAMLPAKQLESPSCSIKEHSKSKLSTNQYAIALTLHGPTGMHIQRASREERKITVTLVCLVITFFIFQGPSVLTSVMIRFTTVSKSMIFENLLIPLSLIALAIKSDLYFFFYCWFCDRFLNKLCKLFGFRAFQNWVRRVRNQCKKRIYTKHISNQFLWFSKPSLLQEYQLPHHHYGQPRKPAYLHGAVATHNRYPYLYRSPPLPFTMEKKRKFAFNCSSFVKWNRNRCTNGSNVQKFECARGGLRHCKSHFVHNSINQVYSPDIQTTFVPPPKYYFSTRCIVVDSDSRRKPTGFLSSGPARNHRNDPKSYAFIKTKNRCTYKACRVCTALNSRQPLLSRFKRFSLCKPVPSNGKDTTFSKKDKQRLAVEKGAAAVRNNLFLSNPCTKSNSFQSANVTSTNDAIHPESIFRDFSLLGIPLCISKDVPRSFCVVPRELGTVSAPVSNMTEACVHFSAASDEGTESATYSTTDADNAKLQPSVVARMDRETTAWSV